MALLELSSTNISGLQRVEFGAIGLMERSDLQRLIRDHIDVISPNTLVISEEFSGWDRSDRRIDLLGVDRQARLVVVELKRTTDDSLADLQALRYAAMVSNMTFDEAVETFRRYLARRQREYDPKALLLQFLGWDEPTEGRFGEDVRIVLAAADFSPEVTSTVLWLNQRGLDFACVRIQPSMFNKSFHCQKQRIIKFRSVKSSVKLGRLPIRPRTGRGTTCRPRWTDLRFERSLLRGVPMTAKPQRGSLVVTINSSYMLA